MAQKQEKKNLAKTKIVEYILNKKITSKVELSKQLNLSMPTVLSNIKELTEKGLVMEVGEYESTGGRKAKSLGVVKGFCYAMGMNITANHVGMVLINLCGEIERQERKRLKFAPDIAYCQTLASMAEEFLKGAGGGENVLGIGIALPGIINTREMLLVKSHALQLENYSLKMMEQMLPLPVHFENDANAAMMAENLQEYADAVYLSLNHTLGGAVCINGQLFTGQNRRAGEFGHMVLVPGGRPCYCGKEGCADAYCSAGALMARADENLDSFVERLENNDAEAARIWDEYLDHLAVLVSNLRMAYDTDIILGGDVGGYLPKYLMDLSGKVFRYNMFDGDISYLKTCSYRKEASAVGAAKHFFSLFIRQI